MSLKRAVCGGWIVACFVAGMSQGCGDDACTGGACVDSGQTCQLATECDDGLACTEDACVAQQCEHHPVVCADGLSCVEGICRCNEGTACGNDVCVDLTDDPLHCGDCATACDADAETCEAGQCVDADECEAGTDDCAANATCTNTAPGFECACNAGFVGDGVQCSADECATGDHNCDVNAICTDTPTAFTCACNAGYVGDGVTCVDVDECATNTDTCDDAPDACVNLAGSYACACPAGYDGNGEDANGCADLDECLARSDNCDANATCTNTVGGFTCTCVPEYEGDGVACLPLATLSNLVPSYSLVTPGFAPLTRSYDIKVPLATETLALTPFADTGISILVGDEAVTSGATSSAFALEVGDNPVTISLSGAGYGASAYQARIRRGEPTHIKASNASFLHRFGQAMAIDGNTLVVGAPGERSAASGINGNQLDNSLQTAGAVYVFERINGVWSQQAYIKPLDPMNYGGFGGAVALEGDTLAVGASPRVYLFTRTAGVWSQAQVLQPEFQQVQTGYGLALSLSGDSLAVGAPSDSSSAVGIGSYEDSVVGSNSGAVFIYTRSGGVWSKQVFIKAANRGVYDSFGTSVALDGETLVVGSPREDGSATGVNGVDDDALTNSGAVYVFERSGVTWTQVAYLKSSHGDVNDGFGAVVDLDADTLVVGAPQEDGDGVGLVGDPNDDTLSDSGAVYAYARGTWAQTAYIKASNPAAEDHFGSALDLYGDRLVIGAPYENGGARGVNGDQTLYTLYDRGAAYLFGWTGSAWAQSAYLKPNSKGGRFGSTVALEATAVAVGSPDEYSVVQGIDQPEISMDGSQECGAVYAF